MGMVSHFFSLLICSFMTAVLWLSMYATLSTEVIVDKRTAARGEVYFFPCCGLCRISQDFKMIT
jgi:hypothetical protein